MTDDQRRGVWKPATICVLFLVSGATGLIYEVVWSRQLGALFGYTTQAAAVVLGSYFAGLALGTALAGRLTHQKTNRTLLLGYGIAELVIAFWALLTPSLIGALDDGPLIHSDQLALRTAARGLWSFLLLLPATTALGATFPLLAQYLTNQSKPTEQNTSRGPSSASRSSLVSRSTSLRLATVAYGLNTAGAFLGVVLATFVFLLAFGGRFSGWLAALGSGGVGVVAVLLALSERRGPTVQRPALEVPSDDQFATASAEDPGFGRWLLLAGISGAATLGLQVLYTGMFSLVFHNSSYTFGLVVAVFLLSLSLGTWLSATLAGQLQPQKVAGGCLILGGALVCISVLSFVQITNLEYFPLPGTFLGYVARASAFVGAIVGPSVITLGVLLPTVWRAALPDRASAGATVGWLTAVNSVAAALGSLGTSFLLVPTVGLWNAFAVLAAVVMAAGMWMLQAGQTRRRSLWPLTILVPGGALILLTQFLPQGVQGLRENEHLLKRWNSSYGWIDVVQNQQTGNRRLIQNVHYGMGSTATAITERRQARLPLLLHQQPREVLFLGLATGVTAGESLNHPEIERIAIAELIPEIVSAARLFDDANGGLLDDPRVSVRVNDARYVLKNDVSYYDVIIADLFVPWESQTGYLYTVEHYRRVRDRLKRGGLFCQWIPSWQVGSQELEIIANSLAEVFPHVTFWWGRLDRRYSLIALVGSNDSIVLNAAELQQRIERLQKSPNPDSTIRAPGDLLALYSGDWPRRQNVPLNTDDRPRLEFLAPVTHAQRRLLKGQRLIDFYDSRLVSLPAEAVIFPKQPSQTEPSINEIRQRQREWLGQTTRD